MKWLHDAPRIVTRYRPGELLYEIRDPLLGADGMLRLSVLAYHQTEGLIVRVEASAIPPGLELIWAYGGVNGQRGARDGDIGTERVPISQYFQLQSEFCKANAYELKAASFTLHAKPATILGLLPPGAQINLADATHWNDLRALLADAKSSLEAKLPVLVGRVAIENGHPLFISLQRIAQDVAAAEELSTYREVSVDRPSINRTPPKLSLAAAFLPDDLPRLFDETEPHFTALRQRVSIETPDPFLNAAAARSTSQPMRCGMNRKCDHARRDRLAHPTAWLARAVCARCARLARSRPCQPFLLGEPQNTDPIPTTLPLPAERSQSRSQRSCPAQQRRLSNSHYDMNLVYHRHFVPSSCFGPATWHSREKSGRSSSAIWRGNDDFFAANSARKSFRFTKPMLRSGPATICNTAAAAPRTVPRITYYHNKMAAQLAPLVGDDPAPYEREADLIARGMRELLWLPDAAVRRI